MMRFLQTTTTCVTLTHIVCGLRGTNNSTTISNNTARGYVPPQCDKNLLNQPNAVHHNNTKGSIIPMHMNHNMFDPCMLNGGIIMQRHTQFSRQHHPLHEQVPLHLQIESHNNNNNDCSFNNFYLYHMNITFIVHVFTITFQFIITISNSFTTIKTHK